MYQLSFKEYEDLFKDYKDFDDDSPDIPADSGYRVKKKAMPVRLALLFSPFRCGWYIDFYRVILQTPRFMWDYDLL